MIPSIFTRQRIVVSEFYAWLTFSLGSFLKDLKSAVVGERHCDIDKTSKENGLELEQDVC